MLRTLQVNFSHPCSLIMKHLMYLSLTSPSSGHVKQMIIKHTLISRAATRWHCVYAGCVVIVGVFEF